MEQSEASPIEFAYIRLDTSVESDYQSPYFKPIQSLQQTFIGPSSMMDQSIDNTLQMKSIFDNKISKRSFSFGNNSYSLDNVQDIDHSKIDKDIEHLQVEQITIQKYLIQTQQAQEQDFIESVNLSYELSTRTIGNQIQFTIQSDNSINLQMNSIKQQEQQQMKLQSSQQENNSVPQFMQQFIQQFMPLCLKKQFSQKQINRIQTIIKDKKNKLWNIQFVSITSKRHRSRPLRYWMGERKVILKETIIYFYKKKLQQILFKEQNQSIIYSETQTSSENVLQGFITIKKKGVLQLKKIQKLCLQIIINERHRHIQIIQKNILIIKGDGDNALKIKSKHNYKIINLLNQSIELKIKIKVYG